MMPESAARTFICSVVSVDLVGYSKKSVEEQISIKERFNQLLTLALKDIPVGERIILDTGDGAAMSFLGDPEDALKVAMDLKKTMNDAAEYRMRGAGAGDEVGSVRIGMNLGPVRLATDVNGRPNIIGDGINMAERIMCFAPPGEIAVSHSYCEFVSRISDEHAGLFSHEGARTDDQARGHEIYLVAKSQIPAPRFAGANSAPAAGVVPVLAKANGVESAASNSGGFIGFLEDTQKVTVSALGLLAISLLLGSLLIYRKNSAAPGESDLTARPADKIAPVTPSASDKSVVQPPPAMAVKPQAPASVPVKPATTAKAAPGTTSGTTGGILGDGKAAKPSGPLSQPASKVEPAEAADALLVTPKQRPIPEFPPEAIAAGETRGVARARLKIDAKGNVSGVQILESPPSKLFDRAMRDTLMQWKFNPGADGRGYTIEIEFKR